MDSLITSNEQLPSTIPELAKYVLIGREKLSSIRAEIRAIDKVGIANAVREQKLAEAQDLSELLITCEVKIGELLSEVTRQNGKRTDLEQPCSNGETRLPTKQEIIKSAGFSRSTANKFEILSRNVPIVEQMKLTAREQGDVLSRQAVLQAIKEQEKPFVTRNTGYCDYYTPEYITDSARKVMGGIDLDPASCEVANRTVKAEKYYTVEDDGLSQEWFGRIYLNPPYSTTEKFIYKLYDSEIEQAVVVTLNATETRWFLKLVEMASAIVFVTGRMSFVRGDGQGEGKAMQGQVITYVGKRSAEFLQEFCRYGWGTILSHTQ